MIVQESALRVFVVVYNVYRIARDHLTSYLDTRPEVNNWYAILPGQLFLVSREPAATLAAMLRARFPDDFLLVAQISGDKADGFLPQEVWDFINTPKSIRELSLGPVGSLLTAPGPLKKPNMLRPTDPPPK